MFFQWYDRCCLGGVLATAHGHRSSAHSGVFSLHGQAVKLEYLQSIRSHTSQSQE